MRQYFSENIVSRIIHSLDRGEIPLKYNYLLPEGADAWSNIENNRSSDAQLFKDTELLLLNIDRYLQELGNPYALRIMNFGSGSGDAIKPLLRVLLDKKINIEYYPVDFSNLLLASAVDNISQILPKNTIHPILQDFEDGTMSDKIREILSESNIPTLGIFIGSTIGNFKSPGNIIHAIMDGFGMRDRLVIGAQRSDTDNARFIDSLIKEYSSENAQALTCAVIREIDFPSDAWSYLVQYNTHLNQIEIFAEVKHAVVFPYKHDVILYEKGEKILLAHSKKFNEITFTSLFSVGGYRLSSLVTDQKDSYMQAMIALKR